MRRTLALAALALLALPSFPTATAAFLPSACAGEALCAFTMHETTGWARTPPAGGIGWFRVDDPNATDADDDLQWFAARVENPTAARPAPDGYADDTHVALTSPSIVLPAAYVQRSIGVTLRGSSEEGVDNLTLQWAPSPLAAEADWKPLRVWSGSDLEEGYVLQEVTSVDFLRHSGPFALRFRFDSNEVCDSDPGTPGIGSTQPTPDDPGLGEGAAITECPTTIDREAEEPVALVQTVGWFVDTIQVVARRNFVAAACPSCTIDVSATGGDVAVDLLLDRGKVLAFNVSDDEVSGSEQASSVAVRLQRQGSGEVLSLAADRVGRNWTARLAVDEPDLVAGTWTVSYFAIHPSGGILLGTHALAATAADAAKPVLSVSPAPVGGAPARLGPGEALAVQVQEALLRRITYSYAGLPAPVELPFPYLIPVAALPEGPTALTLNATDRTGHAATLAVSVDRDTVAPTVGIAAPAAVYAGVPFDLDLVVTERSAHTLRVDTNGTVTELQVPAGQAAAGRTTTLRVTAPGVGNFTVQAFVNDTVGNQGLAVRQLQAVRPVTDLRVDRVRLASPATAIAREGQSIVATVEQAGGVAPMPVNVTFTVLSLSEAFNVTLPASGEREVRWNASLPGGQHKVRVRVEGPALSNETAPGDEESFLDVEVFLGRVVDTDTNRTYLIRADARGLPASAVLANSTKTYPLTLVDSGKGVAYRFTLDGNRTVDWDPLEPVMTIGPSSEPEDKDTPAPGALLALLAVAAVALARRRRR